jgi:restriction system protein
MVGHGLGQPLHAVTLERSKLALILQKIHRAQRQSRDLVSFVDAGLQLVDRSAAGETWRPGADPSPGRLIIIEYCNPVACSRPGDEDMDVNGVTHSADGDALPAGRKELLAFAAQHAAQNPVKLPIRSLLQYWNAKRRGYLITEEIRDDLAATGLITNPPFTEGWIDSLVALVPIASAESQPDGLAAPSVDVAVAASVQVSLRVNSFASANAGVEWVRLDDSLERAQTLMMGKDYSQLAVQSGPRDLRGAISWESIAQAKIRKPDADLRDAMFTPEVVGLYDDLLARIPLIVDASFAFVRASDRQICGIVTTADLSDEFATLAKPFFLLAEVERRLRRIVDNHFTREEIAAIVDPADPQRLAASASDLTIGQFIRLLEEPRRWAQLHWSLDRVIFIAELNDIRLIRNEIMHFSPDPLDDEQIRKVELFLRMLRRLDHRFER